MKYEGITEQSVKTLVERFYAKVRLGAVLAPGRLPQSLFSRWLALFRETARDCFGEAPAAIICDRALKTARNLESALAHGDANSASRILFGNSDDECHGRRSQCSTSS